MRTEKKKLMTLNKPYAIAELNYKGEHCFLVAAEKQDPCYLFAADGTVAGTVWTQPGGTMSMEQIPGSDGAFLAIQKFYSPNDSAEAMIMTVTPKVDGWEVKKLCDLPFVHRFGILKRDGRMFLMACTVKSAHEYKDDWRFPGAVWAAQLPQDLSVFDADHQLELTCLKEGMLKNHGFSKLQRDGFEEGLVGCENGTFLFTPPAKGETSWQIRQICDRPSSDSVLIDLDGDGKEELGFITPFHGNSIEIWHQDENGAYAHQWTYPVPQEETGMLHATWPCRLAGKAAWVIGWRKGTKKTGAVIWNSEKRDYEVEILDENAGSANVMYFEKQNGRDVVIAANRENDEIALYFVE